MQVRVCESNVRDLLAAAALLRFYAIETACQEFLRDRLDKSNCLRMLKLAHAYNLIDLVEGAMELAAKHFLELSEGFVFALCFVQFKKFHIINAVLKCCLITVRSVLFGTPHSPTLTPCRLSKN